ncbi:histidine phosphatase family protein [Micrococcales bacterium 31B]|nr:histidine phosphatase family protein [Micrococcales bacterium 31B]
MSTIIHVVRHCETVWHAGNRYAGATDVELTSRGLAQAAALAEQIAAADLPVAALYSSDLQRAAATAQPTARALGLDVTLDARLREVNYGIGEGLTSAEHLERFPEAARAFVAQPADAPFPEGESGRAAHARAAAALDDIASRHVDGSVLVFAHATIIRLLATGYLGIDLNEYRRCFPLLDNCTLTSFEVTPGSSRARILRFNAPAR